MRLPHRPQPCLQAWSYAGAVPSKTAAPTVAAAGAAIATAFAAATAASTVAATIPPTEHTATVVATDPRATLGVAHIARAP